MEFKKLNRAFLGLLMLLIMSYNLRAKENNLSSASISGFKITVIDNKMYFKWLACKIKDDGVFIIEEKSGEEFCFIDFKAAIGVPINAPILYCSTIIKQSTVNKSYRIKYVSVNNDSLFSDVTNTNVSLPEAPALSFEEDYLSIKVLKDSLPDEVGIVFTDTVFKRTQNVPKKVNEGANSSHLFLKSNLNVPVSLKASPFALESKVIPLHFKHSTGGFFTMVFMKHILNNNIKVYLDNIITKELTEIINQDSLTLYLSKPNDGASPSFNLIFITKGKNQKETEKNIKIAVQKSRKAKPGTLLTSH